MTQLGISTAPPPDPIASGLAKIKWSIVVPWAVSVTMFGAQGYHRFVNMETSSQGEAAERRQLAREVADLRQQVAVMQAIVQRIEARQIAEGDDDDAPPPRRRPHRTMD